MNDSHLFLYSSLYSLLSTLSLSLSYSWIVEVDFDSYVRQQVKKVKLVREDFFYKNDSRIPGTDTKLLVLVAGIKDRSLRFAHPPVRPQNHVTETMLAPVLLFDKDVLYLLWYKCEHIKFKDNVSPGAVEVVAIFDNPTKEQLHEMCASFPEEAVKLPERRCAVSLGNVRVWQVIVRMQVKYYEHGKDVTVRVLQSAVEKTVTQGPTLPEGLISLRVVVISHPGIVFHDNQSFYKASESEWILGIDRTNKLVADLAPTTGGEVVRQEWMCVNPQSIAAEVSILDQKKRKREAQACGDRLAQKKMKIHEGERLLLLLLFHHLLLLC